MTRYAMMHWKYAAIVVALLIAPLAFALGSNGASQSAATKREKPAASHTAEGNGERIFQQNCSRCHRAPEGFPPRISGTVVRHMRVRASLSEKDARALLRFLNP